MTITAPSVRQTMIEVAGMSVDEAHDVARHVLDAEYDGLGRDPLASMLLGSELHEEIELLAERMDDGRGLIHTPAAATRLFVEHLEELGATETLKKREFDEEIWNPTQSPVSELLGLGVFEGRLLPALTTTGMAHPAIPSVIIPNLARLVAGPLDVFRAGGGVELRTRKRPGRSPRRVAHLVNTSSAPDIPIDVASMAEAVTDINVQRWLRDHICIAWHTQILGSDTMVVEHVGGYGAVLGRISGKAATRLKKALHLLRHVVLPRPSGIDTLIELTETRGARAHIKIELTGPLRIGFVNHLKKQKKERNLRLVPLPPGLPPRGNLQTNRHSAACAFEMLLLNQIRKRAEELVDDGSIHLAPEVLHAEGEIVGLPPKDINYLMTLWCDGPGSLLTDLGDDQYDLGPSRELMHQFLTEGAGLSRDGTVRRARSKNRRSK